MWRQGEFLHGFKSIAIIYLYKRKSNRQLCKNHRGIFLLNIAGKIFARVLLNRLNQDLEQGLLPESQCSFRRHRGTTNMINTARRMQKCQEMRIHLYPTFVDLTKAFGTASREMVHQLCDRMTARITDNGALSEVFAVSNGVKWDCVPVPILFSLMFSVMLMDTYHDERPGIRIAYRTDDQLLNQWRMPFQSRVSTTTVHELLFADDCTLNATSERDMQRSMHLFTAACGTFVLVINTEKTVVMHQPPPDTAYVAPKLTTRTTSAAVSLSNSSSSSTPTTNTDRTPEPLPPSSSSSSSSSSIT
nr:unnamed protein product [Spirometra erinaceieuropaei]